MEQIAEDGVQLQVLNNAHADTEPPKKKMKVDALVWSSALILQLISIWGSVYVRLGRGNLQQSHWESIARNLNETDEAREEQEQPITVTQCQNKIQNLKKQFKQELSMKQATGGVNSTWQYFGELAPFLATTPKMAGIPNGRDGSRVYNVPEEEETLNNKTERRSLKESTSSTTSPQPPSDNGSPESSTPPLSQPNHPSMPEEERQATSSLPKGFDKKGVQGQRTKDAKVKLDRIAKQKANLAEQGNNLASSLDSFVAMYAETAKQNMELQRAIAKEKVELQVKLAESNAELQRKMANDRFENELKMLELKMRLEKEFAGK